MTFYEYLKQCSVESVADVLIAIQLRYNTDLEEFLQSEEYKNLKKAMVKYLNSEMDNGV